MFDGPARAIRSALAAVNAVRDIGLNIRVGIHTGECEVIGDKLAGIAVHTGARVAGQARAGEVLVSSTVRDLVAGSGLEFEDRGQTRSRAFPASDACLLSAAGSDLEESRAEPAGLVLVSGGAS